MTRRAFSGTNLVWTSRLGVYLRFEASDVIVIPETARGSQIAAPAVACSDESQFYCDLGVAVLGAASGYAMIR